MILFVFYVANSLLDKRPSIAAATPFLILLVFSYTNQGASTFLDVQERYFENGKYDLVAFENINKHIVSSIVEGSRNGSDSVLVSVPKINGTRLNWPFIASATKYDNYVNTLHKHGLIHHKPKGKIIIVDPDE